MESEERIMDQTGLQGDGRINNRMENRVGQERVMSTNLLNLTSEDRANTGKLQHRRESSDGSESRSVMYLL